MDSTLARKLNESDDAEVKRGAHIMQASPGPFDDARRTCNDVCCAIAFLALVGVVASWTGSIFMAQGSPSQQQDLPGRFYSLGDELNVTGHNVSQWSTTSDIAWDSNSSDLSQPESIDMFARRLVRRGYRDRHPARHYDNVNWDELDFMKAAKILLGASIVSMIVALTFLQLTKICTECVVYVALLLSPIILVAAGCFMLAIGEIPVKLIGVCIMSLGVCMGSCILCCWADCIGFTVHVLKAAIMAMQDHPSMIIVSIFSSFLAVAWIMVCFLGAIGVYSSKSNPELQSLRRDDGIRYMMDGGFFFVYSWGAMVFQNCGFVALCGVFGRWYYGIDKQPGANPVGKSAWAAFTTSFGSVCLGSFTVAAVRALEFMIHMARRDAQEDGDFVTCIILCILESVISCIGDLLEWFNQFAYVQCAVRGLGFCQAVSATYALCTVANIKGICACSLVDSVVFLGSIPSALAALGATYVLIPPAFPAWGAHLLLCVGFVLGMVLGVAVLQPLSSGATTFVVCWAENPSSLHGLMPHLHKEFCQRGDCWDQRNNIQGEDAPNAAVEMRPSAPAGPPAAARQMMVTVPAGVVPGQVIQFTTPEGLVVQVAVPQGKAPGEQFTASY